MTMTVKRLIGELEKIENKFLEVEIMSPSFNPLPVNRVVLSKSNKKVFIITEDHINEK